jgi:LacI family transcriptional regulator
MMKKRAHTKISDIAHRLNVSSVTVSKALRGHPDISPETTARIKKVAMEMGYVPNLMARRLSARTSQTIGVIVPKIAHSFFSKVIEAIYDVAAENNYEILLTVSQERAEREAVHLQTLLSMHVDGLIVSISQETESPAVFVPVLDRGVPLTFMDRILKLKGTNSILADDHGGAFAATEQAIKAGYRRIGHLGGPQHLNIGRERYRGFEDALREHDIPLDPAHVIYGGFSEQDGYKAFMKLPEVIFTVTFPVALGVLKAAKELDLKLTRDYDLISFGSGGLHEYLSPSITIIEQPTTTLGRAAVELTLEHIKKGESFKPQHIQLPTKLVMGETCVSRKPGGEEVPGGDREAEPDVKSA